MNCYHHNNVGAVASCASCGKGLCSGCSDRFGIISCEGCIVKNNSDIKKRLIRNFIFMGILFVLGLFGLKATPFFDSMSPFMGRLLDAYWLAAIPFGWSAVSGVLNRGGWFVSMKIWIILPVIKLIIAMFIGGLIAPFGLYRDIKEYMVIRETESYIQQNNTLSS